jgi:imidazolonepropionase-like amidohydrolase
LSVPVQGQAPAVSPLKALRAAGFVDARAGTTISPVVLAVDGDRIKAIGSSVAVPKDATLIDLLSLTLAPGLIDVHIHLLLN